MRGIAKIVFVLTFVCVICAFLLALVAQTSSVRIKENEGKAVKTALFTICPQAKQMRKVTLGSEEVFKLLSSEGTLIGYGFLAKGQGYQGTIKIMAVADKNFEKLLGIEIIESQETPGLGAKINESFFKNQFKGVSIRTSIEYTKGEVTSDNQIKAITGATISSASVVNILNKRIAEIKKALK